MEIIITPRAPFDFAATARFLRFTEAEAVDIFKDGIYRRAFSFGNHLRLLNVEARGTVARPFLAVTLARGVEMVAKSPCFNPASSASSGETSVNNSGCSSASRPRVRVIPPAVWCSVNLYVVST